MTAVWFTWKPILLTTNHIYSYIQQNQIYPPDPRSSSFNKKKMRNGGKPNRELGLDSLFIFFFTILYAVWSSNLWTSLTYYKPKLNSGYTVVFSLFLVIGKRGDVINTDSSIPLTVEGSSREFRMIYSSKNRESCSFFRNT